MKTIWHLSLAALFAFGLPAASMADVPTAIRVISADNFKDRSKANKDDETEIWAYRVVLQNNSGRDLSDLEMRYRIFYFEQLDSSGKPLAAMTHLEGKVPVPALKKLEKKTVNSEPMPYGTGGNKAVRAERDVWKGIWVRIFDKDGKELGSLVKPASFAKSNPWN
jgi:hypothetical protein